MVMKKRSTVMMMFLLKGKTQAQAKLNLESIINKSLISYHSYKKNVCFQSREITKNTKLQ